MWRYLQAPGVYGAAVRVYGASRQTVKLIRSIRVCRTPALGGRRITCKQCGDVRYQYFSCGNSLSPPLC
ncbi:MAG: transposase zinc-binding domain-containing protein [Lewinellaceae bacterium]|nr:transposase zinc-binding domain-containing protein [Lewinellaceae bacterium]MCB9352885.1 transposase zinc-binding domain-containing protein [Lewinellaceae bacterium]